MEKIQIEVISGYCAKLPRKAKELSFYHKTKDQDPDETVEILDDMTLQSYSLTCPLSQARQSVPVRTNSCTHVDTFDLASCIKALPSFELINCYSRLILKAQVDLPQNCPICKVKDTIYVDGIIETFIKFNPNIDRVKFTESGEVVANESFGAKFNETINLASPFPNCNVDVASSSCSFYSSPPFSDSSSNSSRLECSQDPVAFGPHNRSGLTSPLVEIRKMCSPPEKIQLNHTINSCNNHSDVHSSVFDDPSKNTSIYNSSAESLVSSAFEVSNPFRFCRSPYYSQLYAEASAFQFPDSEEAVVAVSRRRFSTVDLDSPRPIY